MPHPIARAGHFLRTYLCHLQSAMNRRRAIETETSYFSSYKSASYIYVVRCSAAQDQGQKNVKFYSLASRDPRESVSPPGEYIYI